MERSTKWHERVYPELNSIEELPLDQWRGLRIPGMYLLQKEIHEMERKELILSIKNSTNL